MAKKIVKKETKKPVAKKPAIKKAVIKKPVVEKVEVKDKPKILRELKQKMGNAQLKVIDKEKGNANDKIVADLLKAKIEKYWGKQKSDLE